MTFEPPSGAPVELPTVDTPMTDQPPSRRQRNVGLVVVLLLIVAALAVVFAIALLRNDSAGGFDYAAAAENVGTRPTAVTATVTAGAEGNVTIEGENVPSQQVSKVRMQLGEMLDVQVITDAAAEQLFIGSQMFTDLIPGLDTDKAWIRVDADQAAAVPGFEQLVEAIQQNGFDSTGTAALSKATTVQDLGFDDIEGTRTKHFRATVPFSALSDASAGLQEQLDQLGVDGPDDVAFDVWVTEDDQVRRLSYELDLGITSLATTADFTPLADDYRIEVPAADESIDLTDLIPG
jgi:hypothetical protein